MEFPAITRLASPPAAVAGSGRAIFVGATRFLAIAATDPRGRLASVGRVGVGRRGSGTSTATIATAVLAVRPRYAPRPLVATGRSLGGACGTPASPGGRHGGPYRDRARKEATRGTVTSAGHVGLSICPGPGGTGRVAPTSRATTRPGRPPTGHAIFGPTASASRGAVPALYEVSVRTAGSESPAAPCASIATRVARTPIPPSVVRPPDDAPTGTGGEI